MNYPQGYDTNESIEATQALITALQAELDQGDYTPHTEQQLELELRS